MTGAEQEGWDTFHLKSIMEDYGIRALYTDRDVRTESLTRCFGRPWKIVSS